MKRISKSVLLILALLGLSITSAYATLPAVVGTTLDGIETDGLALIDLVWPVVGSIVGGFILIKIFKRGTSKI